MTTTWSRRRTSIRSTVGCVVMAQYLSTKPDREPTGLLTTLKTDRTCFGLSQLTILTASGRCPDLACTRALRPLSRAAWSFWSLEVQWSRRLVEWFSAFMVSSRLRETCTSPFLRRRLTLTSTPRIRLVCRTTDEHTHQAHCSGEGWISCDLPLCVLCVAGSFTTS